MVTLLDSLSGKANGNARDVRTICYNAKAVLILGADLSQQHPLLANQIRANYRHHKAGSML